MDDIGRSPFEEEIGGTKYKFAPLDFEDWALLEQRLRSKIVALARDALPDTQSERDRRLLVDRAYCEAAKVSLSLGPQPALELAPSIVDKLPDDDRRELLELLGRASAIVDEAWNRTQTLMSAPDILVYMLWLSLRHEQPKLVLADATRLVEKMQDSRFVVDALMRASRGGADDTAAPTSKKNGEP